MVKDVHALSTTVTTRTYLKKHFTRAQSRPGGYVTLEYVVALEAVAALRGEYTLGCCLAPEGRCTMKRGEGFFPGFVDRERRDSRTCTRGWLRSLKLANILMTMVELRVTHSMPRALSRHCLLVLRPNNQTIDGASENSAAGFIQLKQGNNTHEIVCLFGTTNGGELGGCCSWAGVC